MSSYKSGNHVHNCLTTLPSPVFLVIKIIKSADFNIADSCVRGNLCRAFKIHDEL